ncbi:GerAB/ArcD/ProY family transporter [Ectobacillus polymachus]|uniref:GerAB/ArcD/ProY family transporter n=1 Tax=Ectobacillus polymachus TaxID=1508806 RepID=UPI003A87ABB9
MQKTTATTISPYQYFILIFFFIIGNSILTAPSLLVSTAKQQGWIPGILSLVIGVLLAFLYTKIADRQKRTPFIAFISSLYGKWIALFFTLHYLFFFCTLTALVLRSMGDFVTTQIITEAPIISTHIVFMILVVYGVKLGLPTICRFGETIFPIFLVLVLVFFFFVSTKIEPENFLPFFPFDYKSIAKATITFSGFPFFELCTFLVIQPYVVQKKPLKKVLPLGTLLGGMVLILLTLLCILVLTPELTSSCFYPSYAMAQKIRVTEFIERTELVMAVLWFISLFFKIAISFYNSVSLLGTLFAVQKTNTMVIPLASIIIIYSMVLSPNDAYIPLNAKVWPYYAVFSGLIFPCLLLLRKPKASKN